MTEAVSVHWFRRDLRLKDNASLYQALKSGRPVLCLFIFDTEILKDLPQNDARVCFIERTLRMVKDALEKKGSTLLVRTGRPLEVFKSLVTEFPVQEVHTNRDYEPYAKKRDEAVAQLLKNKGIAFCTHKDQCIFEPGEVRKDDGTPYTVFTPYFRRWQKSLEPFALEAFPSERLLSRLLPLAPAPFPATGFRAPELPVPDSVPRIDKKIIETYDRTRDNPGIQGTTRLGVHLRFGTVSVRSLVRETNNPVFLSELAWRDFFMMILAEFPHSASAAFKPAYDRIEWRQDEEAFELWKAGKTGYPMVDAGMRELRQTGFMHNRVRMVTASFLCKHLLIDWRKGERWFAQMLFDFDLSANAGNWQWAAGSGCDAAPYFRIFNPLSQQKKFDPDKVYIRKWLSEADMIQKPIVEHTAARERCLKAYKGALRN